MIVLSELSEFPHEEKMLKKNTAHGKVLSNSSRLNAMA